ELAGKRPVALPRVSLVDGDWQFRPRASGVRSATARHRRRHSSQRGDLHAAGFARRAKSRSSQRTDGSWSRLAPPKNFVSRHDGNSDLGARGLGHRARAVWRSIRRTRGQAYSLWTECDSDQQEARRRPTASVNNQWPNEKSVKNSLFCKLVSGIL